MADALYAIAKYAHIQETGKREIALGGIKMEMKWYKKKKATICRTNLIQELLTELHKKA